MTRNVYGTYTARCEKHPAALYEYLPERQRLGLDREQYRIYSGRGGRRSDRLTFRACCLGVLALTGFALLLSGHGGSLLVLLTAALLAWSIGCAVGAKRAQMARYARCGYSAY